MARVERVTTNAREELRRSVVLPDATAGGSVVEGERRWAGDRGEEVGIGPGLGPTEVLDAEAGRVRFEPEEHRPEAEIEERDPALAVGGCKEEVGAGGLHGEEVAAEREWGPPYGRDERRERRR